MLTLYEHAQRYRDRYGWRCFPVAGQEPLKGFSLLEWRAEEPADAEVRRWFDKKSATGWGVLCGTPSGGLVAIDFDDIDVGRQFLADAGRAGTRDVFPCSRTRRGVHLFAACRDPVAGRGGDEWDLKSEGGYVVLPPSPHPKAVKVHYRWENEPDAVPLFATVDQLRQALTPTPAWAAEFPAAAVGAPGAPRHATDADRHLPAGGTAVPGTDGRRDHPMSEAEIERSIVACVPREAGLHVRNRCLGRLARRLSRCPRLCSDAVLMEAVFIRWFELALPVVGTKNRSTSWTEFVAWLHGCDLHRGRPAATAETLARARSVVPKVERLHHPLALVLALDDYHAGGEFHLAYSVMAEDAKLSIPAAGERINHLCDLGWLKLVRGEDGPARLARTYVYRGPGRTV